MNDKKAEQVQELSEKEKSLREETKKAVESAARNKKKKMQEEYDEKLTELNEILTVAKEAEWLYEKFGEGDYNDILGLCKISDRAEIAEKGYSLTAGAYVGVVPVEDDGVDFHKRMTEIHNELLSLQAESDELMDTISKNIKEMGL